MSDGRDDRTLPRDSVVPDASGARMRCPACGASFPRREATTPKKGRLACPECGATGITDA